MRIVFENCAIVDAQAEQARAGHHVLVEDGRIREVSDQAIKADGAVRLDVGGRTLMPGLIDAHVHVTISEVAIARMESSPLTLMTAEAAAIMRGMLDRGFTTVRDCAGADWGLAQAVERGLLAGPRLFIAGRALSQTGGHGDFRRRTQGVEPCACSNALSAITRIADGVPEVRKASRDELRKGADQIKVMVSGGVLSPNDPLENTQYSPEELTAIVEEAAAWNTYVAAHAYTPASILHAMACGVRTIEHGNLLDREAARAMKDAGAYLVPTLVIYEAMNRQGAALGLPETGQRKLEGLLDQGMTALTLAREAGVKIGFGTDLLGVLHDQQSRSLSLQAEIQGAHGVICAATAVNAEILGRGGELGVIAPGALADILIVDGNPLDDLGLLQNQGAHLSVIMKDGKIHKNVLS